MKTITINTFYKNIIRRYKNDIMDHFISDNTKKYTLPKYISAIDKEFIYVKPKTGEQPVSEKIIKFDFPARDTLNMARTNKKVTTIKIQLKGVNTNDKIITSTPHYEGISDENNLFHLIYLSPLEQVNNSDDHFEFNRWWVGINPNQSTLVGGSLIITKNIQNIQTISKLSIKEGIIQTTKKLENVTLIEPKILLPKTQLNKFVLDF